MSNPVNPSDKIQTKKRLASVSARANHCQPKSGLSGLVVGVFGVMGEEKRLVKRRGRVSNGADTRLITPYTSYLLCGFQ